MADEQAPEIQINVKGPSELKLQIAITTDKTVLELKQAIAGKSDVEAERQRLIYSGRVLKDDDLLSVYKIQSGHTIHMVKGVNRSAGSSGSTTSATPAQLPTMQTGQSVHDPLTQLNSHLGYGAMAGLNPFADMGLNPNDPNMMQSMMDSPQFLEQMSSLMRNPAVVDQIIAMNPELASMGPSVRQAFQDERFQQLISNPEALRGMLQMSAAMRGGGGGGGSPFGGGGMFGNPGGSFPLPGDPTSGSTGTAPSSGTPAGGPASPGAGAVPPFGAPNPNLLAQMLGMGGGGGAAGMYPPFGSPFGATGAPPPPTDSRPPEERFQAQLQQLQEMGFTNAAQNVRALLATAGNVHSAIEYILGGGGI